jgi:hypothetical protein
MAFARIYLLFVAAEPGRLQEGRGRCCLLPFPSRLATKLPRWLGEKAIGNNVPV